MGLTPSLSVLSESLGLKHWSISQSNRNYTVTQEYSTTKIKTIRRICENEISIYVYFHFYFSSYFSFQRYFTCILSIRNKPACWCMPLSHFLYISSAKYHGRFFCDHGVSLRISDYINESRHFHFLLLIFLHNFLIYRFWCVLDYCSLYFAAWKKSFLDLSRCLDLTTTTVKKSTRRCCNILRTALQLLFWKHDCSGLWDDKIKLKH